nr:MFS transporter [Humitalea rosea]
MFFGGSFTAWTGLWMQRIAVAWLAWELTGSALWVGLVAFADLAPAVIFSPIAGAVADRADRVRLATLTQSLTALQATIVATLTWAGVMQIELLIALEFCAGTVASFTQPTRQSLLPGLIPLSDLPAAVAANSLCFNLARFIGPALAGPIIAVAGVVPAIACNAIAFTIAAATMPLLNVAPAARRGHPATASLFADVREGLTYAWRHPGLGPLLLYAALTCLFLRGVQEILPPFVDRVFGRGAQSLAMLTACFGIGALLAGLVVAGRGRLEGTTRLAIWSVGVQAVATAGFVATSWFPFGLLCAALIGASASTQGISVQVLAQSASTPEMRGRILSLWGLITRAFPALGALSLGASGEAFGLRLPTLAASLLALGLMVWGLGKQKQIAAALEGPAPPLREHG